MQRGTARGLLVVLMVSLAALACALPAGLGGGGLKQTAELWGDVPRMEGLQASDKDLPLFIKTIVRTSVAGLLSGGSGEGDWILFTTDQSIDDLEAYYTNERMAEAGWEASDSSTCATGSAQGVAEVGLLCVFQKQEASTYTGLMLLAIEDESTQQVNVIFVRIEGEQTPTPAA